MTNSNNELDDPIPAPKNNWSFFNGLPLFVIAISLTALFYFRRNQDPAWWIEIGFILSAAATISILIAEACDPFADAAQWVGKQLRLPSSVRGATLDAIASSMPELFTGLFFVIVALTGDKDQAQRLVDSAQGYGSTIATCAGSSIYNLILIPAACAIAVSYSRKNKPYVEIEREVVQRDGMWVVLTQVGLLVFLFQPKLDWWMGVVALAAYIIYVAHLYIATRRYQVQLADGKIEIEQSDEKASIFFGTFDIQLNGLTSTLILIFATLVAAIACYLLVDLTNQSAAKLEVSPFFVAVILTAAVSSIPDTFMSLGSARRGDDSGAVSNVFGSNIFDICVGMSIPLLACCYLNDWQPINLVGLDDETYSGVVGLRIFLFVLTAIAMSVMWFRRQITRTTGWIFVALYGLFFVYAVIGALGISSI